MCARFEIDIKDAAMEDIVRRAGADAEAGEIRPGMRAPVLTAADAAPRLLGWGYARPHGGLVINARSETVCERPMFRGDFLYRRCLVPASGFYEWSRGKDKYFFRRPDGRMLFMGGVYRDEDERFVVLTVPAVPPVSPIHDRIPVLIDRAAAEPWLRDRRFAETLVAAAPVCPLVCDAPPMRQASFFD